MKDLQKTSYSFPQPSKEAVTGKSFRTATGSAGLPLSIAPTETVLQSIAKGHKLALVYRGRFGFWTGKDSDGH